MRYIFIILIFIVNCSSVFAFDLQNGDLLFQDTNCGDFCDAIDSVTIGYNNSYVSHMGLVVESSGNVFVLEAISIGVVKTPLNTFLSRSLDENHNPRVMVGRLKKQYQYLIPPAVKFALAQLGKPYNKTFFPSKGDKFYCSELVYWAFMKNKPSLAIFHLHPMNFKDSKTNQVFPIWADYYKALNTNVPQGVLGTNPGQMSRESSLDIVYYYGNLRIKQAK